MIENLLKCKSFIVFKKNFLDQIFQLTADIGHFRDIESILPFSDGVDDFFVIIAIERWNGGDQNVEDDAH